MSTVIVGIYAYILIFVYTIYSYILHIFVYTKYDIVRLGNNDNPSSSKCHISNLGRVADLYVYTHIFYINKKNKIIRII